MSSQNHNRRRLAIFMPSLYGGGAEKIMLALAEYFSDQDISVDIVVANANGQLRNEIPLHVRLIDLQKSKPLHAVLALSRYIREERPNTLLATVFNANIAAALAYIVSGRRTRLVICEANPTEYDSKGNGFTTLLNRLAIRMLYPRADALIAISEGVRKSLVHWAKVSHESIYLILNPLLPAEDTHAISPIDRDKTILACGRLQLQKDHSTLLKACALLKQRTDFVLLIVGDGSLQKQLMNEATELGIQNEVKFLGYRSDVRSLMCTAKVFAHTSRWEGFGIVLLEALSSGCHIVATDCPGGIRDALADGRYGTLVPVGDHHLVAKAIYQCLISKTPPIDPSGHLAGFRLDIIADEYLGVLFPAEPR